VRHTLDSPVSGGPSGAASGKMTIRVGGDEQIFNRHKVVLDAMGDQAAYIGPIGAGTIAKLVHNSRRRRYIDTFPPHEPRIPGGVADFSGTKPTAAVFTPGLEPMDDFAPGLQL
jgi:hypothetical protein